MNDIRAEARLKYQLLTINHAGLTLINLFPNVQKLSTMEPPSHRIYSVMSLSTVSPGNTTAFIIHLLNSLCGN